MIFFKHDEHMIMMVVAVVLKPIPCCCFQARLLEPCCCLEPLLKFMLLCDFGGMLFDEEDVASVMLFVGLV